MKKKLALLLAVAVMIAMTATPVFAESLTVETGTAVTWSDSVDGTFQNTMTVERNPVWANAGLETTPWVWVNTGASTPGIFYFQQTFNIPATAYNITANIVANCDNAFQLSINGAWVLGDSGSMELMGPDTRDYLTINTLATVNGIVPGTNRITVHAVNYYTYGNPGGLAYKLVVNYDLPTQVAVDIKPMSDPNGINNDGHGVIPLAILGSATLDVTTINPATVALDGLAVKFRGKSMTAQASYKDYNFDGFMDLIVQIEDLDGAFTSGQTTGTVTGLFFNGDHFIGTDSLKIVPVL